MASAVSEPIFISVVKREYRHPYTAATKDAILEEARELIRMIFLLIDISVRPSNLHEPGSISFEIEETVGEYIVRVRGVPRLVAHATAIFGGVAGWTGERKRVTMVLATAERPIPPRASASFAAERRSAAAAAEGPVAAAAASAVRFVGSEGNRPGPPLKNNARATVRARRPRLEQFAEERGLTIPVAGEALRLLNNFYNTLKLQGYLPRDAAVIADRRLDEFISIARATK
jgi:hypothetical protein